MSAPVDVSVVIPTHNRRDRLGATLGSVLGQRDVRLEIVVVDDGSEDGTAAWLAGLGDERLRTVRHDRPQGVARARNAGIAAARGTTVAFLDDDDLWGPLKLRRQLDAVSGVPPPAAPGPAAAAVQARRQAAAGWAISNVVVVDDALRVVAAGPLASGDEVAAGLAWRNTVPAGSSSVLVDRGVLAAVGGFDESLRHFADWDLWIRLTRHAGPPATVPEPDVAYRMHAGNASSDSLDAVAEARQIGTRTGDLRGGRPVDLRWIHRWSGWWSLQGGRRGDAARAYLRAVAGGDWSSGARLTAAVLPRPLLRRVLRRPVDLQVACAAERWLAGLRTAGTASPL